MGNRRHFFKTPEEVKSLDERRKKLIKLVFAAPSRKAYAESVGVSASVIGNMISGACNITDKALGIENLVSKYQITPSETP